MKIVMVGTYDGCNTKKNGSVDLRFRLPYSEIVNYVRILQTLNKPVRIVTKVDETKAKIGTMMVKKLNIDGDGEALLILDGELAELNLEQIGSMIDKTVSILIVNNEGGNENG